jgi:hypothetical protein
MPAVNDPCWRDASGVAYLTLPHRIRLLLTVRLGPTRVSGSADADVLAATGWHESTLAQDDLDRLFPPPPPAPEPTWLEAGVRDGRRLAAGLAGR